jgi:hypothetical protein
VRLLGGPLTVNALANPANWIVYQQCSDGGTPANNTYRYKFTALSGTGQSLASGEASVSCAGQIGVGGVSVTLGLLPVPGADSYKLYRTVANGASGTELGVPTLYPANILAPGVPAGETAAVDTTVDGALSGSPPAANTTGNATVAGVLAAGGAPPTGAVAGDLSAVRDAGRGMLWMGGSGAQSLDFGVTNPGFFSLLGGGLIGSGLILAGSGQLFIGSTTVATLPVCNASNRLSWLAVTDANAACAYGAAPAGGGANVCPVFCDGSAWKIH